MKNVTAALAALLIYGGAAQAANVQTCTITVMPKENPNFLMHPTLPQLPRMGDVIDLDLDAKEIDDLTFKSKTAIALKQNNAKLVNLNVPAGMGIVSSFRGTFKSPTGDYTAVLFFQELDKDKTLASLEIARLKFFEGFSLARYTLECVKAL